jgi:transposase
MTTAVTHHEQRNPTEAPLFVAFALREKTWKLGCPTGHGQKPRERTLTARQHEHVRNEIAQAQRRCGLPDTAPVVSGYAAGREGFWLHRFFQAPGITNHGVDASAIAGNRRRRRATSEGVAVRTWLRMLMRSHHGERQVWPVVTGPSGEAAAHRHRPRDLATLQQERASTTPRLQGLRSRQGLRVTSVTKLPAQLEALRLGDGAPMPPGLRRRVLRVSAHHTVLSAQSAAVAAARRAPLHASTEARLDQVRQWRQRTGSGSNGAWLVVMAVCGWRPCKNRRDVGGVAGCTPTRITAVRVLAHKG